MTDEHARRTRPIDVLGWLCLIATLLSTSFVVSARADEPEEALMSVDPALVGPPRLPAPRIVTLNTRGYNYGPPPDAIDDAAKRFERPARPGRPAAPAPMPPR